MKRTRILYKIIERFARRFRFEFLRTRSAGAAACSLLPQHSSGHGAAPRPQRKAHGAWENRGKLRVFPNAGAPPAAVLEEMSSHFPSLHHFTARGSNLRHRHPRALLANAGWDTPRAAMFSALPPPKRWASPLPTRFAKLSLQLIRHQGEKKIKTF